MRPLVELKKDFQVVGGLGDIIDVFKMASVIQFRIFAARRKPPQDFALEAAEALACVREDLGHRGGRSPFFNGVEGLPSMVVVVCSDEGFMGEINTLLINAALDCRTSAKDELVVLGERGARYLEEMRKEFGFFPGLTDELHFAEAVRLRDYLWDGFGRKFGRVMVVYPHFVSLTVQKVTVTQFLPLPVEQLPPAQARPVFRDLLIEPDAASVIAALARLWAGYRLFDLFWSAKQAEYAARIMNLESSGQELAHLKEGFSREYFRQVHTLRDRVIREITASRLLERRR